MGQEGDHDAIDVEVVPLVVVSQTFPARPSSIPEIRDFVRRCLSTSSLSPEDNRAVGDTVSQALLDAAGPTGTIQVSFRIFPDHVEVDVLRSHPQLGNTAGVESLVSMLDKAVLDSGVPQPRAGVDDEPVTATAAAASFAEWMAESLRKQGLTMEAAARQLGVSVRTVSRWVGGTTEPRLRELRRIREVLGEIPFP
jgi:hypothetical protein